MEETTVDYVVLGARIRQARLARGLTQDQLSEACSLSTAHVGHIERGTRIPSLEALFRIAKELYVNFDYLLFDSVSADETLLSNVNALLKSKNKLDKRTIVIMIRALVNKLEEM